MIHDTANVALCEHGLNGLIAGIRCNFFSKLVQGAYVHSIARRELRRLPACLLKTFAEQKFGLTTYFSQKSEAISLSFSLSGKFGLSPRFQLSEKAWRKSKSKSMV